MTIRLSLLAALPCLSLLAGSAAAQTEAAETPPSPFMASVQVQLVLPQADADDLVSTSLGFRSSLTYRVHPNIAVLGSVSYVLANETDLAGDAAIAFYTVEAGARFSGSSPGDIAPFGEVTLGRHTVVIDFSDESESQSDLGFRFGGGLTYRLAPSLRGVAQLSYSTAEIEDVDIAAFSIEAGLGFVF